MKQFRGLIVRTLFIISLLALFVFKVDAQGGRNVSVSVTVLPPYSTNAKDYVQQGSNVMITITNLLSVPQQVIVIPSLSGSNGVKAALRSNYVPPAGLLLGPAQVRVLTLNQLKATNNTVTLNDIVVQTITKEDYQNNKTIPEGTYTFCVNVKNFTPAAAFDEQTCASFVINSYDPPIILNPVDKSTVKPLNPQFLTFGWTPSGIGGKTRYSFKLVDLTATPLNNPNDAFDNNNIVPFYEQSNIVTGNFVYDNSKPKLKEGNKYAVRIVAYDPQNKLLYKNKGRSQVIVFTYKNELLIVANPVNPNNNNNNPQNDPPKGPCVSTTKWGGSLKNVNKNGIPNGTNIAVGHFVVKNTVFSKSNGSYDGSGEIEVNFLNTRVKVEFTGIKINDDNRLFEGKITGKVVNNNVIDQAMAKEKTGSIESVPNMDQLMTHLENNARKVSNLAPEKAPVDLPVHFDKNDFSIGVVGIIFEATEAYINALLNTELPQTIGNSYLLLSAKGIPVHPNGYSSGDMKLSLAKEVSLNLSDKLSLVFTPGTAKTFATFDCDGFKSMTLNGAVALSRTIALPVDDSFDVIADTKTVVKAPFELKDITSINEFLLDNISFSHKFVVADANDFVFECKNLSIDMSSSKNGTAFTSAYPDKANKKDWIGLYVKNITLTLPEGFKKKGGGRMSLSAENAYVDKMGFSGKLSASGNVFSEGTLASWGLSLNKIDLTINQSKLAGGGIGGLISLPLGDNTDLGFFATISKGDGTGAKVALKVETNDEIDANLFLAKIRLFEGSSIEVGKENGKYFAKAILNGEIGIAISSKKTNSNVSRFDLPDIKFQELTIDGKDQPNYVPNFDLKFASLQNQKGIQAKIGGFELNLNGLEFKKSGDKKSAGLGINLGISLFGGAKDGKNGAGAKTGFTIWAKHDGTRFKYDKASLDDIAIDVDMGVAKLKGSLSIYDEDPTYGNGFRGQVAASLAGLGVGIDVTMQFGRTLEAKGDYKYWYFDAMLDLGSVGLNIPGTAASLYGFGGGAWCNMTRSGGKDVIKPGSFTASKKDGPAPTSSGVTMTPQKGIAGFKAAVLFGITGSREAFNGDLTFEMELNSSTLAVNHIKLEGNAYLMQNPVKLDRRDPGKAFLYCNALIEYDAPTRVLSGNFGAHVNILNIIQGGGDISFKFDMPDKDKNGNVKPGQKLKWYIKVGQWTPGKDPFEDDARLHAAIGFDATVLKVEIKLQGYFMVGNDLPSGLPPLPDEILAMNQGAPVKKDLPSSVSNTQSLAFAFGAGIKLTAGFDIKIVSASVTALAGFDVLISDLNATCDGKEMGFNGWYAQGQAYAYIGGSIKFLGLTVASVEAGAVFQVKLPNPTWVRGDVLFKLNILRIIKGEFWKTIERGKMCANMKMDINPFEGAKLIKTITPGDKSTNINPLDAEMRVEFTYDETTKKIYNAYTENYDYYFSQNQVKLLDKNKKEVNKSDYLVTPNSSGRHFVITTKKTMEAFTDYYIWAKAEIVGEAKEEQLIKFTTGDRPTEFGMKDVVESYPLPNQRFFMKQELDGKAMRGFIKLKQDLAYLFQAGEVFVLFFDKSDKMVAHAKATAGTQNAYQEKSSSTVYFDIPKELKTGSIYEIKILGPDPQAAKNNNAFGKVVFQGFWFGTSKYNNFQEKLNTYKVVKTGYVRHLINVPFKDSKEGDDKTANTNIYLPVMMIQGGEEMDGYEMFGYYREVNNEESLYGKLFTAMSPTSSDFLHEQKMKYTYLKTPNGHVSPELTETEFNTRYKIAKDASKAIVNIRPPGYPFDKQNYGAGDILFTGGFRIFWMKNIQAQEAELRKNGYLTGNEKIGGPLGPLTGDDINGGGGFVNNKLGLGNNGPEKTVYYALIDYSPLIAGWAHAKWVSSFFKETNKVDADIYKSYKVAEKLGVPKMPGGKYEVNLQADAGIGTGGKTATVKLSYNYSPPK